MSNTTYNLYVASTMALTKSLIVKSTMTATAMNDYLTQLGQPVLLDNPHSWRYYMNLSGSYHPSNEPMSIISIDTLKKIPFTKEALASHPATLRAYQYNTRYYKALVQQYPKQRELIRGIINPVDIDHAIKSPDFTILHYEPPLVEPQETNVIKELQTWIYNHLDRWHNPDYRLADTLYPAAVLGILFINIPSILLNIRLSNCGTNRAHSFHVWSFLGSHGELDRYKDALTIKQALYLYRNIRYITENNEKAITFNELVDNLLTKSGYPLYAFDIVHNLKPYPERLVPKVEVERYPITLEDTSTNTQTIYSVNEILSRENPLGTENKTNYYDALADITHRMQTAEVNRVQTKVLETELRGNSSITTFNIATVRLNHWYFLSTNRRYIGRVNITNPLTGEDNQLTPVEALILYLYCLWGASGVKLNYVPNMVAIDVLRLAPLTVKQLQAITDTKWIPDQTINEFRSEFLALSSYNTPESFIQGCDQIVDYLSSLKQDRSRAYELYRQANKEVLHNTATHTVLCALAPPNTNYTKWLVDKNISALKLTAEESALYAQRILNEMVGIGTANKKALKRLEAMVKITTQLSHYDLQILVSDSSADAPNVPYKNIKIGGYRATFVGSKLNHKNISHWRISNRRTYFNDVMYDMHKTSVHSTSTHHAPPAYWSVRPIVNGVQWSANRVTVNVNHTRFHAVDQGA